MYIQKKNVKYLCCFINFYAVHSLSKAQYLNIKKATWNCSMFSSQCWTVREKKNRHPLLFFTKLMYMVLIVSECHPLDLQSECTLPAYISTYVRMLYLVHSAFSLIAALNTKHTESYWQTEGELTHCTCTGIYFAPSTLIVQEWSVLQSIQVGYKAAPHHTLHGGGPFTASSCI